MPTSRAAIEEAAALPRGSQPPYRKVLCATDLSPTGDSAVRLAYRLAAEDGEVCLLHVRDPRSAGEAVGSPVAAPRRGERVETAERCAQAHLERLPVRGERPDVSSEEVVVLHPHPATAIEAESRRADAIVLGTRGRVGLRRLLLGSVARDVLGRAKVPVILFHDPDVGDP